MSRFRYYKEIYIDLIPFFLPSASLVGFMTGLTALGHKQNNKPIHLFTDLIGYSTLGIITGFTYPVSFPLMACYVLHKNYKELP